MIARATGGEGPPLLRSGHHPTHLERDWTSPFWQAHFEELSRHHRLIRYLARNPGRVRRLVIQTGHARGRAHRGAAALNRELDPFLGMLRSGAPGRPDQRLHAGLDLGGVREPVGAGAPRMVEDFAIASAAEDVIASRLNLDRFDARADMAALDLPVLVIHARNCTLHPLEEGRVLAAGIRAPGFASSTAPTRWACPRIRRFARRPERPWSSSRGHEPRIRARSPGQKMRRSQRRLRGP